MKNRIQAAPSHVSHAAPSVNDDPSLQTTDLTIGGKVYTLCFDLRALAIAERDLRAAGHDVSIYRALPGQTLENILIVFAAAIRRFHPQIGYDEACALLALPDIYKVGDAIGKLWELSTPDGDTDVKANPIQPGS